MTEDAGGEVIHRPDSDVQLEMWGEMLAVERERIASRDRVVEAMREGFAKLDAVDERQFKFHRERLRRDDEFRNRNLDHRIRVTWIAMGAAVGVLALIAFMAFWGDAEQRAIAMATISHALTAGGAFAAGLLVGRHFRR